MKERWKTSQLVLIFVVYFQLGNCDVNKCAITHECAWWEFDCGSGNCVNIMNFCDGIIDCPNGSDEIYVSNSSTGCSNVQNNATHKCELPSQYFCDSIIHCDYKYDEDDRKCQSEEKYQMRCDKFGHCVNKLFLNCSLREEWSCSDKILCRGDVCTRRGDSNNEVTDQSSECESIPIFRCDSGECLEAEKFCDGIIDCEDGSDEIIELSSGDEGMMCSNAWNSVRKTCRLPPSHLCDGIDHCDQRVDECQVGCQRSFICDNGKCIYNVTSVPLLCNGMDDCGDSSDECGVNLSCHQQHNVFTCDDGSCLAIEKFCDGRVDCPDGSDEILKSADNDSIICKNKMNTIQLKCLLPKHHVCDQSRHCADSSDELHCNDSRWFKCDNNNSVDSTTQVCNFKDECCDSSDECGVPGCNKTFHCVTSGECLAFERFCDGTIDCEDGSDEWENTPNGVTCNNAHNSENRRCHLPDAYVCDGLKHCMNREDECAANCSRSFVCNNGECLERSVLCDGRVDCLDGSDEVATGVGFKCTIARTSRDVIHTCVIPQSLIKDDVFDCRDQSDACSEPAKCFLCATADFYVANNQVCDGVINCPDASDECLCGGDKVHWINEVCDNICLSKYDVSCKNCNPNQVSCDEGVTCYNISQSCDGVVDCNDGLDERYCSFDGGTKQNKKKSPPDFICNVTPGSYEFTYATKCDGIPECTNFEDECASDNNADLLMASTESMNNTNFACGEKTAEFCKSLYDPITQWFHCPGKRHMILFPQDICDGMEDCPREEGEDYSPDEQNCHERIKCNSSEPKQKGKITIHVSMLCDGIIDCNEEEDEAKELCNEPSRFYCENRGREKNGPLFVSRKDVFDGKDDCWDGSDECPTEWFDNNLFSSHHQMIKNVLLSCMVWIMAILALFGNFLVVWHTSARSQTVRRISNMMKSNYLLVCNLAAADFLMGIYLLALAVKNSSSSGRYCRVDREWRSSTACSVLGSFAMVSIQSSVMFLLILTTYRVVAVIRPFKAEFLRQRYTFLLILMAWAIAIMTAVIPHAPALQDYFVSTAWLSSGVYFFTTNTQTKSSLLKFAIGLDRYQHNGSGRYSSQWEFISKTINQSYPDAWNDLNIINKLGYYGTNSVCLPRLFVTTNDSAWGYSTIILTFDFCAFIYIVTSYIIIYYDATRITATRNNRIEASAENKTMQTRITRLVVTDFACWVPVCILAFLSLLGVNLGSITYAIAAIVLLPINSALNPILYSNMLSILYSCFLEPLFSMHTKHTMDSRRRNSVFHKLFCCRSKCCSPTEGSIATSNIENMQMYGRIRHMSSNESTMSKTALSTATSRA